MRGPRASSPQDLLRGDSQKGQKESYANSFSIAREAAKCASVRCACRHMPGLWESQDSPLARPPKMMDMRSTGRSDGSSLPLPPSHTHPQDSPQQPDAEAAGAHKEARSKLLRASPALSTSHRACCHPNTEQPRAPSRVPALLFQFFLNHAKDKRKTNI